MQPHEQRVLQFGIERPYSKQSSFQLSNGRRRRCAFSSMPGGQSLQGLQAGRCSAVSDLKGLGHGVSWSHEVMKGCARAADAPASGGQQPSLTGNPNLRCPNLDLASGQSTVSRSLRGTLFSGKGKWGVLQQHRCGSISVAHWLPMSHSSTSRMPGDPSLWTVPRISSPGASPRGRPSTPPIRAAVLPRQQRKHILHCNNRLSTKRMHRDPAGTPLSCRLHD